jgi:hypothetical protein
MLDIYSRNQSCDNGSKDMRFEYDSSPSTRTRGCGGGHDVSARTKDSDRGAHSYELLVIMTVELDSRVVSMLRIIVKRG